MDQYFDIEGTLYKNEYAKAQEWCYKHGYHYQGDFLTVFRSGGVVDLRAVIALYAMSTMRDKEPGTLWLSGEGDDGV